MWLTELVSLWLRYLLVQLSLCHMWLTELVSLWLWYLLVQLSLCHMWLTEPVSQVVMVLAGTTEPVSHVVD